MKPGIVVIAELKGPVAKRIHELQQRFDPRMASELPPHVTLVGSSGLGPITLDTPVDKLQEALAPVAANTPPLTLHFGAPIRFMQTDIVVLPLDPNGPIRRLHEQIVERLRAARIRAEQPRFTFTPHCTLSFYRELPPARLRELMSVRIEDPVTIDSIQVFRTLDLTRTIELFKLELAGKSLSTR
jgi:2'-5' RNA ligase